MLTGSLWNGPGSNRSPVTSRAALDHYRRMIAACLEHDLTPVVTYNHFTNPRWFAGRGGWGNESAPTLFARFATEVTKHLGELLTWVCTLNEPNAIAVLEATGVIPMGASENGNAHQNPASIPGGVGGFDPSHYRMGLISAHLDRMAQAHRLAFDAIKSGPGDARVGWTLALIDLQPVEGGEERWSMARQHCELDYLDVSRDDDFVGVQTYSRSQIGPDGTVSPAEGVPTMQTGWEVYPQALEHTVRLASEHTKVPVLVTENGMATDDDDARIAYTDLSLKGLARCIDEGVDVRGYLHWTLLDNFEWTAGYAKTFGLVAVDRTTFARTVKPSARWLGRVAQSNQVD